MQPTDSAFDRVKSLLGKMDRSIDEARQRRLDDEDPSDDNPGGRGPGQPLTNTDQHHAESATNGTNGNGHSNGTSASARPEPTRPTSKYGRATPIRETPPANGAKWREA